MTSACRAGQASLSEDWGVGEFLRAVEEELVNPVDYHLGACMGNAE